MAGQLCLLSGTPANECVSVDTHSLHRAAHGIVLVSASGVTLPVEFRRRIVHTNISPSCFAIPPPQVPSPTAVHLPASRVASRAPLWIVLRHNPSPREPRTSSLQVQGLITGHTYPLELSCICSAREAVSRRSLIPVASIHPLLSIFIPSPPTSCAAPCSPRLPILLAAAATRPKLLHNSRLRLSCYSLEHISFGRPIATYSTSPDCAPLLLHLSHDGVPAERRLWHPAAARLPPCLASAIPPPTPLDCRT